MAWYLSKHMKSFTLTYFIACSLFLTKPYQLLVLYSVQQDQRFVAFVKCEDERAVGRSV
jgi:hypothetical protein